MIALAGRPGTAVEPTWSIRRATVPSAAAIRSRWILKVAGQVGS